MHDNNSPSDTNGKKGQRQGSGERKSTGSRGSRSRGKRRSEGDDSSTSAEPVTSLFSTEEDEATAAPSPRSSEKTDAPREKRSRAPQTESAREEKKHRPEARVEAAPVESDEPRVGPAIAMNTPAKKPALEVVEESGETTFEDLNFDPELLHAMAAKGYLKPNDIQIEIFPPALRGEDVVATIPAGQGKTAIILLAAAHRLLSGDIPRGIPLAPSVLVLMETKEATLKAQSHASRLLGGVGLHATAIFEGGDQKRQEGALRSGVDIVFATVARAKEFMEHGPLRLDNLSFVCVDDFGEVYNRADRDDLNRFIKASSERDLQKVFFSAQWTSELKAVASKAASRSANFINVTVLEGAPSPAPVAAKASITPQLPREPKPTQPATERPQQPERVAEAAPRPMIQPAPKPSTGAPTSSSKNEPAQHWSYAVPSNEKFQVLLGLFKSQRPKAALVYTNTKIVAEWVGYKLAANGIKAEVCLATITPEKLALLNKSLSTGELQAIVTTDQTAPSLQLDKVTHVYNFDIPPDSRNYSHRMEPLAKIGRDGVAVSLICEDYGYNMGNVEKGLGHSVTVREIPREFYSYKDESDFPFDEQGRVKGFGEKPAAKAEGEARKPEARAEQTIQPAAKTEDVIRPAAIRADEAARPAAVRNDEARIEARREDRPRDERPREDRQRDERPRDAREPRDDRPREAREPRDQREPRREGEKRDERRDFQRPQRERPAEMQQGGRPERAPQRDGQRPRQEDGNRIGGASRDDSRHSGKPQHGRREERVDERARDVGEATRAAARAAAAARGGERKPFHEQDNVGLIVAAKEGIRDALEVVGTTVLDTIEKKAPQVARFLNRLASQIKKKY